MRHIVVMMQAVQRKYSLAQGDFPPLEEFREVIAGEIVLIDDHL
jgi:hypothetical protein